ncbi:excisionase family DNA-binding protein [Saccharopolyspora sp. K220]|uniref:excisionase family DNA-binding protein n=1 Tax=Saccharopolyspora soli TaxID=2926618 RepID=UPI001F569DB7|nr:excisionase family DNA-binding protein [Saccharopolyspora soli]MCI2420729.1 excisionase family DNA-binding protein [Saccharopolyspora soli]
MTEVIQNPSDAGCRAVTVAGAAEQLCLSAWQVRKLIKDGKLRARNTGKAYIIPVAAINEFLAGSDDPIRHPDSI